MSSPLPSLEPETATMPTRADEVMSLERDYLLQNYGRYPVVLQRGKGCYLYDTNGKRYLDLLSGIGVNALGHAHPRILRVIRDQAGLLIHTSNLYYHEFQGALAKKLCQVSGLQRAFFCNSGAEGNEAAIKMMRSHGKAISPEKYEIVALHNSFHGRTAGALSITGQPKYRADFEPLLPGVKFVHQDNLDELAAAVNERTCGIVIEGIQGEGGILPTSQAFQSKARELADKYDALLVHDGTQCGVGRTGQYFSYQMLETPILPDVLVAAKPVACGIPLGFVLCNERAAASIRPGMHGTTFGGNALACRVALEFFEILEDLLPQITRVGNYFQAELRKLAAGNEYIKDVRGRGLMIGVEFTAPCKSLVPAALAEGLLLNVTHDTVVRFLPPYILTEQDVDIAITMLGQLFGDFRPE